MSRGLRFSGECAVITGADRGLGRNHAGWAYGDVQRSLDLDAAAALARRGGGARETMLVDGGFTLPR